MRTAIIKHRVADFLRQHAPFDCLDLEDLLALADTGRVSFHQANESICRAGDPRKPFLYVVQQGRVDLYEGASDRLRDILTAGDTIGLEHFLPGNCYLDTARTAGDVILYGLDSATFEQIANRYPQTSRFLAAHFSSRRAGGDGETPQVGAAALSWTSMTLPVESIAEEKALFVGVGERIGHIVRVLNEASAAVVVGSDAGGHVTGAATLAEIAIALTVERVSASDGISEVLRPVARASHDDSAGELFLKLIRSRCHALIGVLAGGKQVLVTEENLANVALHNPASIVRAIDLARSRERCSVLRAATDTLALNAISGPDSIEWAGRFTAERNRAMIANLLQSGAGNAIWFGADARAEAVGSTLPAVGLGYRHNERGCDIRTLTTALEECGFSSSRQDGNASHVARSLDEWIGFYRALILDPIGNDIYSARHFLDIDLAVGDPAFVAELKSHVIGHLRENPAFIAILANDALAKLPPLTFYQNVVIDIEGGMSSGLDLMQVAVMPIVDAARALAISAFDLEHVSTVDRLRHFAEAIPDARRVCLDAIEAYRTVAYQSTVRAPRHGDSRALQPATLSKYERELLKSAFRSIAALLEFLTARSGLEAA